MSSRRLVILLIVASCALLAISEHSAAQTRPLDEILVDLGPATESDVRTFAKFQAEDADGPNYKSVQLEHQTFSGIFYPASASTQLAIFSDDGCDVYIDGTKVHARLNQGQALPNLSQSFHPISPPSAWVPGQSYHIRVDYSNTHCQGLRDIDGVTLFAFHSGGTIPPIMLIEEESAIVSWESDGPHDDDAMDAVIKARSLLGEILTYEIDIDRDGHMDVTCSHVTVHRNKEFAHLDQGLVAAVEVPHKWVARWLGGTTTYCGRPRSRTQLTTYL